MTAVSTEVTAGENATEAQYNDLRTDAIRRDIVIQFEVEDTLVVLDTQGGTVRIPYGYTITKIKVVTDVGSCVIDILKNSSYILQAQACTTTPTDITTGFDTASLTENDVVSINITSVSSAEHLQVLIYATRNL